jgi:hypothetical protein
MPVNSQISRTIEIDDLIDHYPFALHYLCQKGIRCVVCGESIWGTLEEAAREKGFDENAIDEIVNELITLAFHQVTYFQGRLTNGFVDELTGDDESGSANP